MDTNQQPLPPAADYEVFLSFRGPDVRTTFADFLLEFLKNSNIRTFFDEEKLCKGEEISGSLFKAIEDSKVYVPILSPGYVDSKWCLRELAHMVKCFKQQNGNIILPIFFMMEPRDVRRQEGPYEEAFRQHSKKFDAETVKQWKDALEEVGKMKGWHVTESHGQGAIVREVFSCVRSHVMHSYRLVTEKLVGIDLHIDQVTNLLNKGVKVVGIVGMGGLGKTTIAMAVRDAVYTKFDYCCFLRDVRETLSRKDGIVTLQNQILSAIPGFGGNIQDASQGIQTIKDRICKQKALIILDDVNESFEFQQLMGKLEDFSTESRFIITTRDKGVLDVFQPCELHEPVDLNLDHSLQLFSIHAFGQDYPPEDRVALSHDFLKVTTGLPLALKVIGSTLMRKNEKFWKEKLEQLKKIPPTKVQERLMVSFLDLTFEEQQIFLDIASVFIEYIKNAGHPWTDIESGTDSAFRMWSACDFYPEIGVDALILKSLIKFNEKEGFWMHDSIRDLGRAIIREKEPWRGSRVWRNKDALDLVANEKGSERLQVLQVDALENLKITDRRLEKLSGLRYLQVRNGEFKGNFETSLPNLCWLRLTHCDLLPDNLNMKKLAVLDLNYCKSVEDDWSGWAKLKGAHNLKSITIRCCALVKTVPDLRRCRNLEFIHLRYCNSMSGELHIGTLKNLQVLKFSKTEITKLSGDITILQNLKEMRTSNLTEIPNGMDRLSNLEILSIRCSSKGASVALPISLKDLSVTSSIHILNLSDLANLEEMKLGGYEHQLPGDMWKLSRLKKLRLLGITNENSECSCLPSSLQFLDISDSMKLKRLPNLANLSDLTTLDFNDIGVGEIIGLAGLRMLETLHISSAPNLIDLDGLEHLSLLKDIKLHNCSALERLPNVWNFTKLEKLEITRCLSLSRCGISFELGEPASSNSSQERSFLLNLSALHSLKYLRIANWERLAQVIGLETLESLKSLTIEDCTSLRELSNWSALKNLETVRIIGCEQLNEDMMDLEKLESLEQFQLVDHPSLKKLSLFHLELLQRLDISRCSQLTEISGLEELQSLANLRINGCKSIKKLPNLSGLYKYLCTLDISGCTQLTKVSGIENLKKLYYLRIDENLEIPPLESRVMIDRR